MKYQIPSLIFLKAYNKLKNGFSFVISTILYERPKKRLSLIIDLVIFAFFRLINPLFGSRFNKVRDKIHKYYLSFCRVNLLRHPVSVVNSRREILRACITYRCNASCKGCYAKGLLEEFPMDMSLDDFVYLIKWAKRSGWGKIMFLGGEPTVHPQFLDILDICYKEGMSVNLSTNAFFDENVLQKLRSPWIEEIIFDYLEGQILSAAFKKRFLHNLECLSKEKISLLLSGIIDGEAEIWKEVVDIALRFKLSIRWSLILPGYRGDLSEQKVFSNPKVFGLQLLQIFEACAQANVPCFVYRPVPICIFTPQQLQQITKMGRYLFFTRCMLGYRGDYTLALTVNPDLSTFPCNNSYLKGPPISYFKDRDSVNRYYEEIDRTVLMTAPAVKCNDCQLYQNFLSIVRDKNCLVKERLFDENICQAGCVDYRRGARFCP